MFVAPAGPKPVKPRRGGMFAATNMQPLRALQASPKSVIIRNYVCNGITRFDSSDHEYGKRAPSGMMIGYIVNMEQSAVLEAVNKHIPDEQLELNFEFTQKVVSCEQNSNRKHVKPSVFKIIHLWTDLRGQKNSKLLMWCDHAVRNIPRNKLPIPTPSEGIITPSHGNTLLRWRRGNINFWKFPFSHGRLLFSQEMT